MTVSDMINAILAVLTFLGIAVALFLGIWSVNETKKLQKKQHAEDLIHRIRQWSFETRGVGTARNLSSAEEIEMAYKNARNAKNTFFVTTGNMYNDFYRLSNEGEMLQLELGTSNKKLSSSIERMCDKLISCADYHDNYQQKFLNTEDDMLKVSELAKEWNKNNPSRNKEMSELRADIEEQINLLANVVFR